MPLQVQIRIVFDPPPDGTQQEQGGNMAQGLSASINTEASQVVEGQGSQPGVHCWYEEIDGRWYLRCE